MEAFLIYIFKATALSTLFSMSYLLLLKNDTSFKLNRRFLVGGILASFALPGLQFTRKIIVESTKMPLNLEHLTDTSIVATPTSSEIEWWPILGTIYFIGFTVFLIKFFLQLFSLIKVIAGLEKTRNGNFIYCHSSEEIRPFSFFKYIVYNPASHSPEELEMILTHERTHARQWHSLDILLVNLQNTLLWFNPLNKIYKTSVIQNLEYLADKETATAAISRKAYQKAILHTSLAGFEPALANQFYQSFTKKRIVMLNKNSSQKPHFWKVSLVLPFIFLFIFTFNVKTEAQVIADASAYGQGEVTMNVSAVISKTSTEEDLQRVKRIFQKQNIDLTFDDLQYSKKGFLTNIFVKFKKHNGTSGHISLSNSEGIASTEIYSNNQETGFRPVNSSSSNRELNNSGFSKLGIAPLYIIGNEKYEAKELFGKHIEVNGSLRVFSSEEAKEMFGKGARDGAVIIPEGKIILDFNAALQKIDLENKRVSRKYIHIEKGRSPALIELESNPENKAEPKVLPNTTNVKVIQKGNGKISIHAPQENEPLIVVEGEIKKEDFKLNSINPNEIKSLNVIKGQAAIDKYGKKAKNGVIEIDLKSEEDIIAVETSATTANGKNSTASYRIEKINFQDDKHRNKTIVKLINEDSPEPLIVVDGKVQDKDFDMDSIDHENIKMIMILKGDKAIEKYGQEAEGGAIEIKLNE